jgi:hypothetical protein
VTGADHLERLRAEVQYARERRDLYRAKVYGARPASIARLKELEREYELAESRLRRAERDASDPSGAQAGSAP